ncbi:hypothetical protein BDZ89DRAFT_1063652 [Hymenopellis radicata]|nr:hypothetical protein BDZ89DRAFT_1063651 [Hymenopellis radicata]KAF9032007.1 hypothetical protein BDZ89DRAFT_1063652 [Hymenopellis radicata]
MALVTFSNADAECNNTECDITGVAVTLLPRTLPTVSFQMSSRISDIWGQRRKDGLIPRRANIKDG